MTATRVPFTALGGAVMNRVAIALLAAGVLAGGCGQSDGPSQAASGPASATSAAGGKTPDASGRPDGIGVVLIKAGSPPRKPLRYRFEAATKPYRMTQTMVQTGIPGVPPQTTTMRAAVDVTIADVAGDHASMTMSMHDLQMGSGAGSPSADASSLLKGLTIKIAMGVNERGKVDGVTADVAGPSNPAVDLMKKTLSTAMADASKQNITPLPDEPVGVGAKWAVDSTSTTMGMSITARIEYEILSFEGETAVVKMTMKNDSKDQDMEVRGRGQKMHIESMAMVTEGTLRMGGGLVMAASRMRMKNRMRMKPAGATEAIDTDQDMTATFEPEGK